MPELADPFLLPCIPTESTLAYARQKFAKQFSSAMRDLWQRLLNRCSVRATRAADQPNRASA